MPDMMFLGLQQLWRCRRRQDLDCVARTGQYRERRQTLAQGYRTSIGGRNAMYHDHRDIDIDRGDLDRIQTFPAAVAHYSGWCASFAPRSMSGSTALSTGVLGELSRRD